MTIANFSKTNIREIYVILQEKSYFIAKMHTLSLLKSPDCLPHDQL